MMIPWVVYRDICANFIVWPIESNNQPQIRDLAAFGRLLPGLDNRRAKLGIVKIVATEKHTFFSRFLCKGKNALKLVQLTEVR